MLDINALSVTLHRDGRPFRALDDIDLSIGTGEIVALLGESGSGKSTLSLAVMGLLSAESQPLIKGAIRVDGIDLVTAAPEVLRDCRRRKLAMIFQDPIGSLNPTMRIGRQLAEAIVDDTPPERWLERVGIPDPKARLAAYPHQLSGGQCQRVMIAMAMAKRPGLIIADEPTTALDVVVQAQVLALLRRLAREDGIAMIFVTHDLAVAAAIADRIAVLQSGRLVEEGPAAQLTRHPAHPYTAALLGARFGLGADRSRQLATLGTEVPVAVDRGNACSFANRCILVAEPCRTARPLPAIAAHGGRVACCRSDACGPDLWRRVSAPWPEPVTHDRALLLELVEVRKTFRLPRRQPFLSAATVPALAGVDLRIYDGEAVALVGGSGSGKSTLLRIAAGLLQPDAGDVFLARGERPQVVFQDAAGSFTPWLSIGEQIDDRLRPLNLSRRDREARVAAAFEQVGLDPVHAAARAGALSGGQCQRAALARAIVVPPRLLLCDEAVSAMDMSLAAAILNLIGVLRRRLGMALLFVTHDLAAARFVADRIVVMAHGRIVEDGSADDLVTNPRHAETRQLLEAMPDRFPRAVA